MSRSPRIPDAARRQKAKRETPSRESLILAGLIFVICAATALTHWPALSAKAYSFDDAQYLLKNPLVQQPGWDSARRFVVEVLEPSTVAGYYQPLAMISLMLDYAAGGRPDNLRPFHRTSLALHVLNTGLVVLLLYRLFGKPWPAALAGLLFGVHPLTVEPIPWIGERKTLLGAFFALNCILLYSSYAQRQQGRRNVRYAASLMAFVLALLSKPTTTPIPALLILLDYWPLRRLSRRSLVEKVPFFLLAGISAVVTYVSQARTASVTLPGERPFGWVPLTLCHNIVFYLYKLAWPARLTSHYPFPEPMSLAHPMVLAGVIGTLSLGVFLALSWRRTRAFVTGWGFFFIAIFPTLGVIGFTDVIASDKFAYLPSLGILMVVAWGLARLWQRPAWRRPHRAVIVGVLLILAVAEAVRTRQYLAVWQNTDRFWTHMLKLAPRASVLRSNYAGFLMEAGREDEAAGLAEEALKLNPDDYFARNIRGSYLLRRNQPDQAITEFQEALRIRPADHIVHGNLAAALDRLGRGEEAMDHYEEALRLRRSSPELHYNFAGALAQRGRADQAMRHYQEAAQLSPQWAEPHNRMGMLLAAQGRLDAALDQFSRAAAMRPDWAEPRKNLGMALAQLGRPDEAIEQYEAALALNPRLADVHFNLATALVHKGQFEEAAAHYREAVRLKPDDLEARYGFARALVRQNDLEPAIAEYRELLRVHPAAAEAHNDLGVLLAQRGSVAEAVEHFREAVRLRPEWAEARTNLETAAGQLNLP